MPTPPEDDGGFQREVLAAVVACTDSSTWRRVRGRRQHQARDCLAGSRARLVRCGSALSHRQREAGRLAGAGLRAGRIVALQHGGNGLPGQGWARYSLLLHRAQDGRRQVQLVEVHQRGCRSLGGAGAGCLFRLKTTASQGSSGFFLKWAVRQSGRDPSGSWPLRRTGAIAVRELSHVHGRRGRSGPAGQRRPRQAGCGCAGGCARSRSCFSSTAAGLMRQQACARWVLGKAMTSRIDSAPVIR